MEIFQNIDKQVDKNIDSFMKELVLELKNNLKSVATGDLKDSIRYSKTDEQYIISFLDYGIYVDFGRKPGSFPPLNDIKRWCSVKGIDSKFAYPIARSIERNGITAKKWIHYNGKPLEEILEVINKILFDNLEIFK